MYSDYLIKQYCSYCSYKVINGNKIVCKCIPDGLVKTAYLFNDWCLLF